MDHKVHGAGLEFVGVFDRQERSVPFPISLPLLNPVRFSAHLLVALDQGTCAVCGQDPVGAKTNEITQFSTLPDHFLDLKGKAITVDALHTQTAMPAICMVAGRMMCLR
ncbi:hypothetical protein ACPROK_08300 [Glutamicibacter soli]|uniref:hypothetical protein n=1 Tax=Glutamicibacter soli TaxID=453836 RepID=UPI003C7757DC